MTQGSFSAKFRFQDCENDAGKYILVSTRREKSSRNIVTAIYTSTVESLFKIKSKILSLRWPCVPGVDVCAHADESDDAVDPVVARHHVQRGVPVEVARLQLAAALGQRLDDLLLLRPVQRRPPVLYVL